MRRCCLLFVAVGCACLQFGCIGRWRPPSVAVKPAGEPASRPATQPTLARYLQATRYGSWVYERRELPERADGPPVRYARKVTQPEMVEGALQAGQLPDLRERSRTATQPSETRRPHPGGLRVSFHVEQPVSPIPAELTMDSPSMSTTEIHYADANGKHLARGTLTRTALIEGVEAVDVPAGHFEDCLRVRVDLTIRFHWGPTIDWTSYIWFNPEAGEVRRVNRLSGLFLIFWFGSAHEYRLVSHEGRATSTAPAGLPEWSHGVLLLNRTIPRPEIGGMLVRFAKP